MPRLRFITRNIGFEAQLLDSHTTRQLIKTLPCQSTVNTWGDEIYFQVAVNCALDENAQQVVDAGTVGFWTEGQCLAIPFGPTPISHDQECRLAARVNILGKIIGNPKQLKVIEAGEQIEIRLITD
ncbi:MAG: cyclophilin-like fold protein [Gammaproteobacteria bacterium]|nr:MAG: cyclophilin-like fold protein [Gammaproteobacteria bacterium]